MELRSFTEKPFYTKLFQVLFILLGIGYIAIIGKEILSPLIFSCLFSILLLPLCAFFERKLRLPRVAAAMLSVVLMLSAVALLLSVVGSQIAALAKDWPQFKEQLGKTAVSGRHWVSAKFHIDQTKQMAYLHKATDKVQASGGAVAGETLISVSGMVLFLIFTFIYTFLFLMYRHLIMKFFEAVFMPDNKALVHEIVEEVQKMIRKYVIGILIEMSIVATFVSTMFLIMGIPYAILLGLITGIFNIVPYIGIFTAMAVGALVTFATATVATKVILVVATLLFTHLVDSNVLLPVIVGSKVRINALITILGVVIGEMIWGIAGMFLSIPVIAVLKIIFDRVESLKPWGLILGDEEKKQNRLTKKFSRAENK